MRHRPPGSLRPQAAREPYGAAGRKAWASNNQPIYGSAGFAISGFRPTKHALRYQSETAAVRSHRPTASKSPDPAAIRSRHRTKYGKSHMVRTFGNRRASGLAHGFGNTPTRENSSGPQAT